MLISDPNSTDEFAFVDSGSVDSSSVVSGNSSGAFDWGGLFTSLSNTAGSIVKATSSPAPVTVRPGSTYLNSQGQLITVPSQTSTSTLLMVGIGVLIALWIFSRSR